MSTFSRTAPPRGRCAIAMPAQRDAKEIAVSAYPAVVVTSPLLDPDYVDTVSKAIKGYSMVTQRP
jgi:hypothetical protein